MVWFINRHQMRATKERYYLDMSSIAVLSQTLQAALCPFIRPRMHADNMGGFTRISQRAHAILGYVLSGSTILYNIRTGGI